MPPAIALGNEMGKAIVYASLLFNGSIIRLFCDMIEQKNKTEDEERKCQWNW